MSIDPNQQQPPTSTPPSWVPPSPSTPLEHAPVDVPVQPVQPAVPVQPIRTARKRGFVDYLLIGAVVLAIGGVAFAVGRMTAPAQAAAPSALTGGVANPGDFGPIGSFDPGAGGPGQGGNGPFGGDGGGLFGGGLTIEGTVTSIDGSSMVIQTANGQEMTVTLDADTTYRQATSTNPGDVAAGDDVTVRVSGGGRFGGGFPGGNGAPDSSAVPSLTATDVTVQH